MPRTFISYTSKDRGFVEQLVADLRLNGVQPWYDKWEMLPGDSLTQKIGQAILDNDYFVVILSPNSVSSEWVRRELGVALNREFRDHRVVVIPVLIADCEVPAFLRDKVYADFRRSYHIGLDELLRALGMRTSGPVGTSVPATEQHVLWSNVTSGNITAANILPPTRQ